MGVKSREACVCTFGDHKQAKKPVRGGRLLYGNQFDEIPAFYVTDVSGKVRKSEYFYCLCITSTCPTCPAPDLVVTKINKSQWDNANNRSFYYGGNRKYLRRRGSAKYCAYHRPVNRTVYWNSSERHCQYTCVGCRGGSFCTSYCDCNPDAELHVTAVYKGMFKECYESNNNKMFDDGG